MAEQRSIRRILTNMQNTVQGLTGPPQGSTALQQQASTKSGWLKKQGGIVKSWHSRWFTLKGDQLYYYSNQDESKQPLGTIFLPGNKVIEIPNNPSDPDKFLFEVVPGGDRNRMTMTHETYPICASSEDERKAWVLALKKVMFAFKGGAIFGQSLQETMTYENTVSKRKIPEVAEMCIEFLVQNGLDVEGIFRLPGRSSVIRKLREEFDCGERPQLSLPEIDVHSVASLLKLFLRELPTPLIPVSLYEPVMKIVTRDFHQDPDGALINLGSVLQKIPRHEYNLLQCICFFLMDVSKNASVNKMSVMNLATVFVQNNIIQPEDNDAVLLMGTANGRTQVAFILVTYCEQLFKNDYNEQGTIIPVDNLLDIGDQGGSFKSSSGSFRERQSASQLLEIDQSSNLPSPLAPQTAPQELEQSHPNVETPENASMENSHIDVDDASEDNDLSSSVKNSTEDHTDNAIDETETNDDPMPDVPAGQSLNTSDTSLNTSATEMSEPRKPVRPAPIPRSRSYRERIIPPVTDATFGDRMSLSSIEPPTSKPIRPTRAPPPPPARPTQPPKLPTPAPEPVKTTSAESRGQDKDEASDPAGALLNHDLQELSREELIAQICSLRGELQQERLQVQSLRSNNSQLKEEHKQQVLVLSKKINDEKTATENAVKRVMHLQSELNQYALKHGNLA